MERWLHRVLIGLVFVVTAAIITRQANFLAPVTKDMLFQKHSVTALLVTAEELSNVLLMLRSKCPFFDFLACIFAATLLTLTFGLFFMRLRARREAAQANTDTGVSFCVNKMTVEEFNDMTLTRQAVADLVNSPEYKAMLKHLGRNMSS
eukprot:GHVQ01032816.1.p1 GENE.GHVQ01032816.1~~GHVQ01032816.1.p1  ORF type:complete len:149 (+),score=23.10 GHVQ01032816.1:522-968(+)